MTDTDVIWALWDGMPCCTLVLELGREYPKTTKEVLDIATRHASNEEAVGAPFILGNVKEDASGCRVAPSKATIKGTRKDTNDDKKG
jgi:hypothetical protein